MSVIQQFPKWMYSAAEPKGRVVHSQEELEALGGEWYPSPADIPADEPDEDEADAGDAEPKPRKKQKG